MTRQSLLWGMAGVCMFAVGAGCSSNTTESVAMNRSDIVRRYVGHANSGFMNGRLPNGTQTNGRLTNGRLTNGRLTNGRLTNGRLTNGTVVAGTEEENHWVLEAVEIDGGLVSAGAALIGMEMDGRLTDGSIQRVRVSDFSDTTVPGMELYKVVFVATGGSICGDKDGSPIWASILPERFDMSTGAQVSDEPNEYTFTCRFGALQKCQEYGYPKDKKAKERKNGVDKVRRFNDYHASCVRMVRADYCGDGVAHTYDGTEIDIYDHLWNNNAIATSTDGSDGFYLEAEWDDDGAHCINKTRWMPDTLSTLAANQSSANPDYEYVRLNCPERFAFSVPLAGGGMSTPDRLCNGASKWNTSVGYDQYAADTSTQTGRAKLRNNSRLYKYTP